MRVATTITGYSGSRNRRAYTTRSIPIEHARAQVVRATRRQPVCESSRRVGRLRGHRLAGARTRTHSRHNDHLWRATGRGSAAGPPRPRHQPAFDSAEANPPDTQTLTDFLMCLRRTSCNAPLRTLPRMSRRATASTCENKISCCNLWASSVGLYCRPLYARLFASRSKQR